MLAQILLSKKTDPNDIDVDIVYTYVNGNDPVWQAKKKKTEIQCGVEHNKELDKVRFQNIEEIRYSLRSVELYAPWVRKIFIITDNQTIPFVRQNHSKIVYVDHTQIIPKFALPTYNSRVIEHCIINIPELSEHFLYLNDDFFFSRPTTKWDFFDKETHLPIIAVKQNNWKYVHRKYNFYVNFKNKLKSPSIDGDEYWASLHYTLSACVNRTNVTPRGETTHSVLPISLTLLRKVHELFPKEINKTLAKHFRAFPDFQFQASIIQTCVAYSKLCKYVELEGDALINNARFIYYKDDDNPFEGINPHDSRTICINSAYGVTEQYYINAKKFLESFLSKKSSFEID